MFEKAITPGCMTALVYLGRQEFIRDFYLAGGTALALQIGHRISTDLDWFSVSRRLLTPERERISRALASGGESEVVSEQDGMLYVQLHNTDVSFIYQHHPLMWPTLDFQGIQLASTMDIGLMKLAAVNARGTRRDFVDLYCLREQITLDELLNYAQNKYKDRPNFLAVAARALTYFEDAERQPMPHMLQSILWEDVRSYCMATARRLTRRLSGLD